MKMQSTTRTETKHTYELTNAQLRALVAAAIPGSEPGDVEFFGRDDDVCATVMQVTITADETEVDVSGVHLHPALRD